MVAGQPGSELEKKCSENEIEFFPVRILAEIDFLAVFKLRKFLRENPVKLIHVHTAKAHSIALLVKLKFRDVKLFVSRRVDFHINRNYFSKLKYFSEKNDLFLTVSRRITEVLIEDGIDPEKIVTIHSGIDLSKFKKKLSTSHLRKEFEIDPKSILIGNVAALVDHKDQETLLRSIAAIQTDIMFRIFILGEGELESKLKKLARSLEIEDKVTFTGFRNDVTAFLNLFHIFTLTSKEEGLGTAVLDAMACGLPVIATRGGGIVEMLTDKKGALLADVKDFSALAVHFKTLIESENTRSEYGAFNLEYVKRFSIDETIRKTTQAYYSHLGKGLYEK